MSLPEDVMTRVSGFTKVNTPGGTLETDNPVVEKAIAAVGVLAVVGFIGLKAYQLFKDDSKKDKNAQIS